MIVESLASVFFAMIGGIVSLIPTGDAPAWMSTGADKVSELIAMGSGLSPWFPFTLAATMLTALFVCVTISFLIKVVRIVASFFTAGGGSAA